MNIQSKAVYFLAAAVIAQPFISKTLNGEWGKYASNLDALAACKTAAAKGKKVPIDYRGGKEWQSRECRLNINHYELIQREVRPYRSIPDWNSAKTDVINRFYF